MPLTANELSRTDATGVLVWKRERKVELGSLPFTSFASSDRKPTMILYELQTDYAIRNDSEQESMNTQLLMHTSKRERSAQSSSLSRGSYGCFTLPFHHLHPPYPSTASTTTPPATSATIHPHLLNHPGS